MTNQQLRDKLDRVLNNEVYCIAESIIILDENTIKVRKDIKSLRKKIVAIQEILKQTEELQDA